MHHVGILYDQFMMHGQRNIKLTPPNQQGYSSISVTQDNGKNTTTTGAARSWPHVRHAALDAFAFNYMQAEYGCTANQK